MCPSYFACMWRSIFPVRWLAAAIIMIATYALPSAAYAHSGHGMETGAASTAPALNEHVSHHARHHIGQSAEAVIAFDVTGQSSEGNCSGFCCATSCAGCCYGSLLMTNVALQPVLTGQQRLSEISDRRPEGVSAEALPRPPKSFV
jgi:hypothetical protein